MLDAPVLLVLYSYSYRAPPCQSVPPYCTLPVPRAIRLASASSEEEQQSWQSWLAPAQNGTSRRYIFRVNTLDRPCLWDMLLRRLHQSSRLPNHSRSQERSTGMSVIFLASFLPLLMPYAEPPCEYTQITIPFQKKGVRAQRITFFGRV